MSGMEDFSGFEVLRAAMEIEKSGHRFYAEMARKGMSELAREVFAWIAQDEVEHLRKLEALVPLYREGAFWEDEATFLPYLRRLPPGAFFPSPERLEELLQLPDADLLCLELAIAAEENFADYFRRAAHNARSEEGREALAWLAEEEKRHARILGERRDSLSKGRQGPRNVLANPTSGNASG